MTKFLESNSAKTMIGSGWKACLVAAAALTLCLAGNESAQATTGVGPYVVPQVLPKAGNPSNIIETWIVAQEASVNIGNGVQATNAMTFKSCSDAGLTTCTTAGIPGPEFRLKVGDQVKVHFVNKLGQVSGIHWHGIELNNASDGTEVTQHAVAATVGTFDYDFIVKRPGVFWYHPHHHGSTNQVFKGLYGSIIIEDNQGYEAALRNNGVIPSAEQTKTLVLSDITVCAATNPATFDASLPHISGIQAWTINYQNHELTQSPNILCDLEPMDENGNSRGPYGVGEIPNIQAPGLIGRMSEGFTVLTNGVNVGGRLGNPDRPGDLAADAQTLAVQAGQGLRLQIVNPSPVRYMRLRLSDSRGIQTPLVRIGGEGGLLNSAIVEGGMNARGFDHKYNRGEILIPPAGRADVVAMISPSAEQNSVLTLWQEDFQRVETTYSWTPTVPVMHLRITDRAAAPYSIGQGRPLLASLGRQAMVTALGAPTADLADPVGEKGVDPTTPAGSTDKDIKLTFFNNIGAFQPSIDGIPMPRDFDGDFDGANPFYLASARHANLSNTMELTVTNRTGANHPFHLHGFSFQPISLTSAAQPSYWFDLEFRDIVDVPAHHTLTFRVSLDDRPVKGAVSGGGGGNGRWLFHCHILPHATFGMMSELHVNAH